MSENPFETSKFEFYKEIRHIVHESTKEWAQGLTEKMMLISQGLDKRFEITEERQQELNKLMLDKLDVLSTSYAQLLERSTNTNRIDEQEKSRVDKMDERITRLSNILYWLIGLLSVGGGAAGVASVLHGFHP